eukprot:7151654-Prymnesium_polylepis.1
MPTAISATATSGTARGPPLERRVRTHQTAGCVLPAVQDARRAPLVWLRAREPTPGCACQTQGRDSSGGRGVRSHMYTNEMIAPPTSWPS